MAISCSSDRPVVDGEVALLDERGGEGVDDGLLGAQLAGELAVLGQSEGLVGGQAAAVAGDLDAGAGGDDLVEGDTHVDAAADEARVDRVVAGVDPHVVIPWRGGH